MKLTKYLMLAVLTAAMLAGAIQWPAPVHAQTSDPVFVGAGDIAICGTNRDEETAKLLDSISGTVFTLGDNVYPDGTAQQFTDCYGASWGRHKARTMPAVGNHDYHTAGAAGYFGYFGKAASPQENNCTSNCKGYYSYNLGAWHIIVLNTEISFAAGSPQEQWLRADLSANKTACTLAYWHEPLYSSGTHGNATRVRPLWQILYDNGADVVLNGHDHRYERFAPQNPNGQADPKGIREFVVGTGGASLYAEAVHQPNSEASNDKSWGVIKLTLHSTSYDWEFVPIAGQTYRDSGSSNCVTSGSGGSPTLAAPTPTTAPATPNPTLGAPTATAVAPTPTLVGPTPIPGSGQDLIFADSFENGLTAWTSSSTDSGDLGVAPQNGSPSLGTQQMKVTIDDSNNIYVTDDKPTSEAHYRARFYLNPNSLKMASGDAFLFFNGFKGTSSAVFRLELGMGANGYQVRPKVMNDALSWTNGPWVPISNAGHSIEIEWVSAAKAGSITLWVDGVQAATVTGVNNGTLRVDRVRLGVVSGIDTGTRGTFYVDAFESRRQSYIGPIQ